MKRGLFTRRSLSVSEQRLRGAEVSEPLLLRRPWRADQALTTGLSRDAQGGVLQPSVPVAEAHRVASAALREHPQEITGASAARTRERAMACRMTRALVPTAVFVALAFLLGALVPAHLAGPDERRAVLPAGRGDGLRPLPQPRPPADVGATW